MFGILFFKLINIEVYLYLKALSLFVNRPQQKSVKKLRKHSITTNTYNSIDVIEGITSKVIPSMVGILGDNDLNFKVYRNLLYLRTLSFVNGRQFNRLFFS